MVVFNLPVVLTSMHGIKRTKDVNVYLCLILYVLVDITY